MGFSSFAGAAILLLCSAMLLDTARAAPIDFNVYPHHPRLFFREVGDSEHVGKADLLERVRNPDSWKADWDGSFVPWCQREQTKATSSIVTLDYSSADRVTLLAFVGWLEDNEACKKKAIDCALYVSTLSDDTITNETAARWRVHSMAFVYDLLHEEPYLTAEKKQALGAKIVSLCGRLTKHDYEHVVGHSHGDQAFQLMGVAAIAGEIDGWQEKLEETLDFYFTPETGYIETDRYFGQDGGHVQGSWYGLLVGSHGLWYYSILTNATTNIRPFESEKAWLRKIPEWYLNTALRGDFDLFAFADTDRCQDPFFSNAARTVTTVLATRCQNRQMRWMYDTLHEIELQRQGSYHPPNVIYDVMFLDKAEVVPQHPKDMAAPHRKARLFSPPGTFFYRDTWDYPESTIIHINAEKYFTFWHQHLDSGAMQVSWKDEMVLIPSGMYPSRGNGSVGGEHHRNWYQRSIGHSGIPLVHNPGEVYERYSARSDDPEDRVGNDGGQHWKKFRGPSSRVSLAPTLKDLLESGGGLAWSKGGFTGMEDADDYVYLHADIAPAYLKEYTESPRVKRCELSWLILKGAFKYPIVLCYHQVESANSAWRKTVPWHFAGKPVVSGGRISAAGLKDKGKCVIDVLHPERFNFATIGGGAENECGYGTDDFTYGGESWAPDTCPNDRNKFDIGKYRVEVSPKVAAAYDEIVSLIMPMGVGESPPSYGWIDESDWYGLRIAGDEYRIHKVERKVQKNGTSQEFSFLRGDSNCDAKTDISDCVFTLLYLFAGGLAPRCADAADADDNSRIEVTDVIVTLRHFFQQGTALPPPGYKTPGPDPTPDGLSCENPGC